jgi:hypothetical protein
VTPSPLADEGAWRIMEQFLISDMSYPQMEDAFSSYLGSRYSADDWKDARDALFSGDGDDSIALANLKVLKARHIVHATSGSSDMASPAKDSSVARSAPRTSGGVSSTRNHRSRTRRRASKVSEIFIHSAHLYQTANTAEESLH